MTVSDVRHIANEYAGTEPGGRADPEQAAALQKMEAAAFTRDGRAEFEALLARLGVASALPIGMPLNDEPFWYRDGHPLAAYRSQTTIPTTVDVLIVGAGLVGASAAWHLIDAVRREGQRVAVIERNDPAGEASGRNGGNFELIPENSIGLYEGLARERFLFLHRRYPKLAVEVLRVEAERQASVVLGLALRNRQRFRDIVRTEGIRCDLAPRGWLFLAHTDQQEQGLCEEALLAARHGELLELWSRSKIREEFRIETTHLGRFIPGDGTYHPFKYVCGLLRCALTGGVELYTRLPVRQIHSIDSDHHILETSEGPIRARRVILATNAFTRELLPELHMIEPRQSQIMVTEHAHDHLRGRFVTSDQGPVYFNQPRSGAYGNSAPLLMGGGADSSMCNPASRQRSHSTHDHLLGLRDAFFPELQGQPPSAEWVGPMAFTPDQLPVIGFARPGVIVAMACNGYGGSYTTAAGEAAAHLALTGAMPDWVPADIFSPLRLLTDAAPFLAEHGSLWRIARSLSSRLRTVTDKAAEVYCQIPEALMRPSVNSSDCQTAPIRKDLTVDVAELAALAPFEHFTDDELRALLALAQEWHLPAGSVLFEEGSSGRSCFVVVRGRVTVSLMAGHRRHTLNTIGPGTSFGEMSLLEGLSRSATCSARTDSVALEFEQDRIEALLAGRSTLALRFLDMLTKRLVASLRNADRKQLRRSRARSNSRTN